MDNKINKNNQSLKIDFQRIIDFVLKSGQDLVKKAGNVADIGITKVFLTEEDLKIERELTKIINCFGSDNVVFGEEDHDVFSAAVNLWVIDPISGTESFIKGEGRYSIVVSYVYKGLTKFSVVYNPTKNELFTAFKGRGAFKNGRIIRKLEGKRKKEKILLRVSRSWKDFDVLEKIKSSLSSYNIIQYNYSESMALSYCAVAMGEYDGIIALTKDCFPEFAGGLMISESGGCFTNLDGKKKISSEDRIFIGGNVNLQKALLKIVRKSINFK